MSTLILLLLSSAGLAMIFVKSPIFKRLREFCTVFFTEENKLREVKRGNIIRYQTAWALHHLLGCALCVGTWCGGICYIVYKLHLVFILYAFAGAIISSVIYSFSQFLDRK